MGIVDSILLLAGSYDAGQACSDMAGVFGLVGWGVLLIKIATPIILIIMGMTDMVRAILGKDEAEIAAAQKAFIKKAIAALCVFLVLTIVTFLFKNVVGNMTWKNSKCWSCIGSPSGCKAPPWADTATGD